MTDLLKKYHDNNKCIFEYHFKSLHSFINYITHQDTNHMIFEKLSSKTGSYDFTKTRSFEEAIDLCKYGCDEKFNDFFKLKEQVSKTLLKPLEKPLVFKDVVGYAPSVSDFLSGSPFNMWNKGSRPSNNLIDIYFQLNYNFSQSTSQVYNKGAISLSLIDVLEKNGYAVNLIPFALSVEGNEVFIAYFHLKNSSSYLNEKLLFFPMCHPSFSRRLLFRLKEVTPFKNYYWDENYGTAPDDIKSIKKYVHLDENSILISTPSSLNIEGQNIYSDLDSMLTAIDLKKYVTRI